MRRFTYAIFTLLVAGCGGSDPQPQTADTAPPAQTMEPPAVAAADVQAAAAPPPKKPLAETIKDAIASSEAAWAARDAKKNEAYYAGDAKVVMYGATGAKDSTVADMTRELEGMFKAFTDLKLKSGRVINAGNIVVGEWVVTGTTQDKKTVGFPGVSVMVFGDEGKITREHLYMDEATIGAQMGAPGLKGRAPMPAPGSTEWVTASGSDEEKKNAETVKALYAAMDKKDQKAIEGMLADDVVYADFSRPDDTKTKAKVKGDFAAFLKAFPDVKMTATQIIPAGKYVVVEGSFTGTMKGGLGPLKASNKLGTVNYIEVYELKDGKIARIHNYANGAQFAAAFLPPPPAGKDAKPPAAGGAAPAGKDAKKP